MTAVLETANLTKRFGGITATDNVKLSIPQGARHALIGPNGAGKTTLVNLLTGTLPPSAGRIVLDGRDITALKPEQRVKLGLVRTFQINQLFRALTPAQALMLAVTERAGRGWTWWRPLGGDASVAHAAGEIAERFRLADVLHMRTADLAYGRQRQLEIALAFACQPRVLLLDEPAAGVPEAERQELLATIAALPQDVTVLLIEHDMDIVFRFANRISVLVNGALLTEGAPAEVARDPRVRAVYLGEADHG
jgi:ABC-type branched-subunit amino acid transport system ATPase component